MVILMLSYGVDNGYGNNDGAYLSRHILEKKLIYSMKNANCVILLN